MLILSMILDQKSSNIYGIYGTGGGGWGVVWPKNNQSHGLTPEEQKVPLFSPRGESFYSKAMTFLKVLKQ
jgi:hypothetical protein